MRHRAAVMFAALVITGLVAGCTAERAPTASPSWVDRTLAAMTVEEKVGQLFVVRVHGTTADTDDPAAVALNREELGVDNALALVERYHVGGIVYFSENVTTPVALAEFGNAIQRVAGEQRVAVPVLTSIDQEQGSVVRAGPPMTMFPGSMALGASRSAVDAATAARITGEELRAVGVWQNYAPVADVNLDPANPVIGARSFSSDPALAASMVATQVSAFREAGIAATAKHFPGHGDTTVDSHTGLPVVSHDSSDLRRLDLPPFRAAIAAGVDSIMTGHIAVPSLDPSGDPATLSRPIVTGLLRESLGYDGVVVTDSLRMEAVRERYGDTRVPVLAVLAGVDQLLDPPDLPGAYEAVLGAVATGEISGVRLDQSVRRILVLKAALGLTDADAATVDVAGVGVVVGTAEHRDAATRITERTTTLVRDAGAQIPFGDLAGAAVLVTGRGEATTTALAEALTSTGASVTVVETGLAPEPADIARAVEAAEGQDLVVTVTFDVSVNRGQAALVEALLATRTPMVVVAVGTPYDIAWFPTVSAYVAAYSYQPVALRAVVAVLTGEVMPTGRLPVDIPSAGDPAEILYPFGWSAAASVTRD